MYNYIIKIQLFHRKTISDNNMSAYVSIHCIPSKPRVVVL